MVYGWQLQREKEQKKQENWRTKIYNKIALESNFPNEEIIKMYLCNNHGYFTGTFVCIDESMLNWIFIRKLVL
jgi:hypothetical protein